MKSSIQQLICVILFLGFQSIASSQNVDEIIEKHIAAHGGAENWKEVNVLKITGKFTAFSLENDYTSYKTKSGCYYGDFHLGEMNVIESFNGESGWTIDPWQEMDYARNLNAGEVNSFLQKAEFFTPFYNYKEKGHTVEYTGLDTLDGVQVYTLALTRTNGKKETWYLDASTYLEYLCKSDWVDFGRTSPSETFFDDFRSVDGLVIPFFIERTFWQRDRILLIEEVEINPEIDKSIFVMPQRKEMMELEFLQGEWEVKVEAWTRSGTWYDLGSTTSSIHFDRTNILQEKIAYERIFAISKTVYYTYNEAAANYRISVFDDLSFSFEVYEGELHDTAFVFNDTQVVFSNAQAEGTPHTQYFISPIDKNNFTLEIQTSLDNGTTWNPKDRFTYLRREK